MCVIKSNDAQYRSRSNGGERIEYHNHLAFFSYAIRKLEIFEGRMWIVIKYLLAKTNVYEKKKLTILLISTVNNLDTP